MDFAEITKVRQSCRNYDPQREVETEKLDAILEAARLAPSPSAEMSSAIASA